jgi:hypothetical protein
MPSIFIWKANSPNISKNRIKIYSGSNWILEENDTTSRSYIYLNQIVISESNNSVITFNIKNMPQDWVGSDLLEVTTVPYEIIKNDTFGILENIGNWFRFTSKNDIIFEENNIKNEYINIKKWIQTTQPIYKQSKYNQSNYKQSNSNQSNYKQSNYKQSNYNQSNYKQSNYNQVLKKDVIINEYTHNESIIKNTNNIKYQILNPKRIHNDFQNFLHHFTFKTLSINT